MNELRLCFLLIPCLSPAVAFAQGSLTPPSPPSIIFKTLQQIEPRTDLQATPAPAGVDSGNANYHFIINQPGSYYLSANLGVTKANGIQIDAEGVTLDLNGFEISRASGAGGHGVEIKVTAHRASVRNGSLKGFSYGVRSLLVGVEYARACVFRDLSVSGCTSYGILAGIAAVLQSCRAHNNSGTAGIHAYYGSSLDQCTASKNTTTYGIFAEAGSAVSNCTAFSNTGTDGIHAGNTTSLSNCVAYNNSVSSGILAEYGSSLTNCSALLNNSTAATSAGITTETACTVTSCTAASNFTVGATHTASTGMGFNLANGNLIQNCTAATNSGDGIRLSDDSVARDNNCYKNGNNGTGDAAGIHSTAGKNRIEANNVTGNDRGIEVSGTGSLVIRNSVGGNTTSNYEIAADNRYGPIEDITPSGTAAVSGNSGAGTTSNSNPWTNFAY